MPLPRFLAPDHDRYHGVRPIQIYMLRTLYFLMAAFVATEAAWTSRTNAPCPLGRARSGRCAVDGLWLPPDEDLAAGQELEAIPAWSARRHSLESAAGRAAGPPQRIAYQRAVVIASTRPSQRR